MLRSAPIVRRGRPLLQPQQGIGHDALTLGGVRVSKTEAHILGVCRACASVEAFECQNNQRAFFLCSKRKHAKRTQPSRALSGGSTYIVRITLTNPYSCKRKLDMLREPKHFIAYFSSDSHSTDPSSCEEGTHRSRRGRPF